MNPMTIIVDISVRLKLSIITLLPTHSLNDNFEDFFGFKVSGENPPICMYIYTYMNKYDYTDIHMIFLASG
jgi:hypothetical protein